LIIFSGFSHFLPNNRLERAVFHAWDRIASPFQAFMPLSMNVQNSPIYVRSRLRLRPEQAARREQQVNLSLVADQAFDSLPPFRLTNTLPGAEI
jgi:hypothetical protein